MNTHEVQTESGKTQCDQPRNKATKTDRVRRKKIENQRLWKKVEVAKAVSPSLPTPSHVLIRAFLLFFSVLDPFPF
jgi:hypothetical protein